jgi:hypothetical protein
MARDAGKRRRVEDIDEALVRIDLALMRGAGGAGGTCQVDGRLPTVCGWLAQAQPLIALLVIRPLDIPADGQRRRRSSRLAVRTDNQL